MKMKVKINENLTSLFNYVNECESYVSWKELVQFALDYKMYQELYMNVHVIQKLIDEHNDDINKGVWKKPQ